MQSLVWTGCYHRHHLRDDERRSWWYVSRISVWVSCVLKGIVIMRILGRAAAASCEEGEYGG